LSLLVILCIYEYCVLANIRWLVLPFFVRQNIRVITFIEIKEFFQTLLYFGNNILYYYLFLLFINKKVMNITKLNFTDKEYSSLVNSYLKILIYAVNIDNSIDRKEISVLFSLFTRTEIEWDNSFFIKLNYFKKLHSLNSDFIHIDEWHFDYLRVLELENLIFYEWEKSLHLILSYLSKHKKDKLSFNDKMEKLDNYLEIIKEIIESKRKQLWDNYVEVFYFWILFYVEIIAMQTW